MKPIPPIRFLTSVLVVLFLAFLSACGELSVQVVTPTQEAATPLADTNTPTSSTATQVVLASATTQATLPSATDTPFPPFRSASGRTQDGGKSWTDITPPHAFDVIGKDGKSAIGYFTNAGSAWVFFYNKDMTPPTGTSAVIWSTTDGGKTWVSSQSLDLTNLQMAYFKPSDLYFTDVQNGWTMIHLDAGMMHDYVTIFATSDGGKTWKEVVDPAGTGQQSLLQSCYKSGLTFVDAKTGWVAADCGGVEAGVYFYKTVDGGLTWTNQSLPAPAATPNVFTDQNNACGAFPPQFVSATEGFMSVKCNFTSNNTTTSWPYATHDGGATWNVLPTLPSPLGSLFFFDSQTGWFLGATTTDPSTAEHAMAQTTDGGKTWKQLLLPTWSGQMDFVSAQVGWVVASDGTNLALVQTTNGGKTWLDLKPVINSN